MTRQRGARDREMYEALQIISHYAYPPALPLPEPTLLEELGPTLGEMKRVLRPGGTMIFSSHNPTSCRPSSTASASGCTHARQRAR